MKAIILTTASVIVLAGLFGLHFYYRAHNQMLTDLDSDPHLTAEREIQETLTNFIVGYSRTISIDKSTFADNPTNWTADVTVEFVNHEGGIDRTNLPYRCYGPHIWGIDEHKLFEQEMSASR